MQSYYEDWGIQLRLTIHSDSSSARSVAKRQGLGKQRHVMTRFLWVQERVRLKHFMIKCIDGKQNPADLMTKALTKNEIEMHCRSLSSEEPVDEEKNNNEPLRDNDNDNDWVEVRRGRARQQRAAADKLRPHCTTERSRG